MRFKNRQTTVILYSQPETPFTALREELLSMLTATNPSGELNGETIPSDANDIILGIPQDLKDLQAGWTALEIPEQQLNGESASGRKRRVGGNRSGLDCPRGAGLKDGAVLAFKFRTAQQDGEDLVMNGTSQQWDVVLPSYDDDYGVGALNAAFNQGEGEGEGEGVGEDGRERN